MIATDGLRLSGPLVAGVDVGGTKASIIVVDDQDHILYQHVAPTDRSALVGQIAGLVEGAKADLRQDVAAVGVAIPGHVDPEDGSVSMAVNLGITHLALGPMLQAELGVPVFVEHDARAAALWLSGQAADPSAPSTASVVFLAIGTGISAGVVLQRGPAPRRQQLCRRGGPRRRRSRGRRLRMRPPRLPRDDRRRSGDRSSGRRRDRGRPKHRPVAGFDGRGRLPRGVSRRRGRGRDRRPGGRPPGPGDPIARPDASASGAS